MFQDRIKIIYYKHLIMGKQTIVKGYCNCFKLVQNVSGIHLGRIDLASRNILYGRIYIKKPCRINQRSCIPFKIAIVSLSFDKSINLIAHSNYF
ncbi:hypothetical protein Hanom_Chr11g01021411 [Helianthus anomalus]